MDDNVLSHIGTGTSGRYPKGSGDTPYQRNRNFIDFANTLKAKGLTPTQVAEGCGYNTTEFRKQMSRAKSEVRSADQIRATALSKSGMNNVDIGKEMGGKNESSIRSLLDEGKQVRNEVTNSVANVLKDAVEKKGLIDIGVGSELSLNVSRTKLMTAVSKLKDDEGYVVEPIYIDQLGTGGNKKTTILVLGPKGTTVPDMYAKQADIKMITDQHTEDNGKTFFGIEYPKSISSDRIAIKYTEDGGSDKDGVIELRRGVDEISLGEKNYAQVRIMVNNTHYLKGMALYSDDLPDGVDIMFNTNKGKDTPKMDVLKKLKTVSKTDSTIDPDNPFGAKIKDDTGQRHYIDAKGKSQLSPINKVNEEGDWEDWSKSLSSQFLSKQPVSLAKKQLGLNYDIKKEEYDEIC